MIKFETVVHLGMLSIGIGAAACAPFTPAPMPITTPSAAAVPTGNASTTTSPIPPTRSPITATGVITLTLWTTEDLAPGTTPAGRILRSQFDAFSAANPNIHIDVVLKKPYGKGGLLDLLTTASAVVPTVLPDLIALDTSEVPLAAEAGALRPLDGWMSGDVRSDFFPFAYKAAHVQNRWVAVPYAVDAQHLVYNKTMVKKAPQTWDELIKQKTTLLLPVGGDDAFLLQYLALAPLNDASNQLTFDTDAAAQVMNFLKRAHDLALIPDMAIGLKSVEELWPTFAAGQVTMAQVSASRYLTERERLPDAAYAPVPTRDGKIATLATGWAFAITTSDPARQFAAARFIQWIVQGERLAPWLRAAHRLPASRSAMILAVDPPEYAAFLRDELERAMFWATTTPREAKLADAWRAAVAAVWKGQVTPEEGARNVAAALK